MAGGPHSRNLQEVGKKEKKRNSQNDSHKHMIKALPLSMYINGDIKDKDFSYTIPASILTYIFFLPHPILVQGCPCFHSSTYLEGWGCRKWWAKSKWVSPFHSRVEVATCLGLEEVLELWDGRDELWQANFRVSAEVFMGSSHEMRGFPLLLFGWGGIRFPPKKVIWRMWE